MDPIPGRPPTPDQTQIVAGAADQWRKVADEAPVKALERIDGAAKQLVTLTGTLQGLYFAVFAFSDVRSQVAGWLLLLFLLPLALWLASLYCATQVFIPYERGGADLDDVSATAWQRVRDTYDATIVEKLRWLHRGHRFLVASFAVVLALLALLALLPTGAGVDPTQIILITPTPAP